MTKAPTLQSFLEDCRAAKTSGEIGTVLDQIEHKIGTMRAERSKFDGQLQEAIVAGRDPGKIHTSVAQLDQDLMTLQAALGGFSQRQADVSGAEDDADTAALVNKSVSLGRDLAAATTLAAASIVKARAEFSQVADLVKQLDRTNAQLEARNQAVTARPAGIVRSAIGPVPLCTGGTEYGRRVDVTLSEILKMNPGQLMRARDTRRQRGWFNESTEFKDVAVEAHLARAKDIERKAAG
jgi:hypothetical protein